MKKLLIILTVIAMMVSLVVACGPEGTTTTAPDNGETTTADSGETTTTPENGDTTYEEKVFISYAGPQPIEGFDYTNGDENTKWLSEKFNYELEAISTGWDDWHGLLSTWIMAQDMPDVINYNYGEGTHADASNFVEQGLIRRMPDDWKTRWPGIAEVVAATALGPMLEELYEGTYFFPRARFFYNFPGNDPETEPLANHWSLWMRGDWIEAVGKEVKNHYTIPEVMEIAGLIKEEDPGNIGGNLVPMSMSAGNSARFFIEQNSTHWDTFYKGSDGNYLWGATAEQTLEGLKLWYEAYNSGILDQEFYLLTHEQDMEKFQTMGIAGISYLGGQTADVETYRVDFENDTGVDLSAFIFATLLGTDGYYHQRDLINFWGALAFSPDSEDAVVERWLDVMEFRCTEDGYVATAMGLKGIDWDRDADGNLISLVDKDVILAGAVGEAKYPSLGHVLGNVILWDDLAFDNPNIGEEFREESRALYLNRYELSTPETFTHVDWNIWTAYTENMRIARGIDYETEFANLVTTASSEENLEQLYNDWIASQMSIIQPVLDELNS